jgi:hypothetical protein
VEFGMGYRIAAFSLCVHLYTFYKKKKTNRAEMLRSNGAGKTFGAQFILCVRQHLNGSHVMSTAITETRTAILKTQRIRHNESVSRKTNQFFT